MKQYIMGCVNSSNNSMCLLKRDDVFNVSVIRVESEFPMAFPKQGYLELKPQVLKFISREENQSISWTLQYLRRYGLSGNVFSFEAGRRSEIISRNQEKQSEHLLEAAKLLEKSYQLLPKFMNKKIFETASSSNTVSDIKERVIQAASGGISLTAQSNNSALSAGLLSIASTETVITSPTIPSGAGASTTLLLPKTKSSMNKQRGPADSLWEFHNIDNFPFQQPNIAGVPITSQENLLLFDLIYCLTGMKGSNITPALETYRSDGRAGSFSLKFNISDQIHSSLRDIAQEILPLSSHYTCLQKFIQNATNTNCSQVLQALNAALETGPGIYTFRCCNADKFYLKFQRYINSIPIANNVRDDRLSLLTMHTPFSRRLASNHNTNNYLEPTSIQTCGHLLDHRASHITTVKDDDNSAVNSGNVCQSENVPAADTSSYENITATTISNPRIDLQSNIKQEYNNNIPLAFKDNEPILSISVDIPPVEYAPKPSSATNVTKSYIHKENKRQDAEKNGHFYSNIELIQPKEATNAEDILFFDQPMQEKKNSSTTEVNHERMATSTNGTLVNYIVLDLDHSRSSFQSAKPNEFGSGYFDLNKSSKAMDEDSQKSTYSLFEPCTARKNSLNLESITKIETSDSYTSIDFRKTLALMKSSANYIGLDNDPDNEDISSRITRHSRFFRKAFSMSE